MCVCLGEGEGCGGGGEQPLAATPYLNKGFVQILSENGQFCVSFIMEEIQRLNKVCFKS